MANIDQYLADIMAAVYGEDVRGSIHDAIEVINDVSEVVLTTGTAVTNASSSSTGFYDNSLYLNTNTYELWKCIGTNSWQSLGILHGNPGTPGTNGRGISSITKTGTVGLVDTYSINYTDGSTPTSYTVTNGADGEDGTDGQNGNKWYRGTQISGKAVLPTVYASSGIDEAYPNDFYLNPSEGAIYYCVTGGNASTATWSYDFTMTGGGGGGTSDYNDLTNKPSINNVTLSSNKTLADLGAVAAVDLATIATTGAYSDLSGAPVLATVATTGAYSDLTGKPSLATVATSGLYSDLTGTPTIPTVNNGTLTITQNGTTAGTFTANDSSTVTANIVTDAWSTAVTVSGGTAVFTGLDDTQGWAYEPYYNSTTDVTSSLSSVSGAGTASMSLTFATDASAGTSVKLRIIK